MVKACAVGTGGAGRWAATRALARIHTHTFFLRWGLGISVTSNEHAHTHTHPHTNCPPPSAALHQQLVKECLSNTHTHTPHTHSRTWAKRYVHLQAHPYTPSCPCSYADTDLRSIPHPS